MAVQADTEARWAAALALGVTAGTDLAAVVAEWPAERSRALALLEWVGSVGVLCMTVGLLDPQFDSTDVRDLRPIIALALRLTGTAVVLALLVLSLRSGAPSLGSAVSLQPLTAHERRLALRQIRGTRPPEVRRLPVLRQIAAQRLHAAPRVLALLDALVLVASGGALAGGAEPLVLLEAALTAGFGVLAFRRITLYDATARFLVEYAR